MFNLTEQIFFPSPEPCVPQNLQFNLTCTNNVATLAWDETRGGQQYRVEAVSADGHMDQCGNHETTCDLQNLQCGQVYTATVVAQHSDCTSAPSDSVAIKTGTVFLAKIHKIMIFHITYFINYPITATVYKQ